MRAATPADLPALAALTHEVHAWHAAAYPLVFHERLDAEGLEALIRDRIAAEDRGVLVCGDPVAGSLSWQLREVPATLYGRARRVLFVDEIAVAATARRHGLGAALIAAARAIGRERGASELALETWGANAAAQAFFRSEGLEVQKLRLGAAL